MTPIDLPGQSTSTDESGVTVINMQTAICFRRKNNNSSQEHLSPTSVAGETPPYTSYDDISNLVAIQYPNALGVERHDCLCLETYSDNYLGFHDVPNALLLDLVTCVTSDWAPGLIGISAAIYSVISDYSVDSEMPVLSGTVVDERRYLQLRGKTKIHRGRCMLERRENSNCVKVKARGFYHKLDEGTVAPNCLVYQREHPCDVVAYVRQTLRNVQLIFPTRDYMARRIAPG